MSGYLAMHGRLWCAFALTVPRLAPTPALPLWGRAGVGARMSQA
jgi:hypothetical protein